MKNYVVRSSIYPARIRGYLYTCRRSASQVRPALSLAGWVKWRCHTTARRHDRLQREFMMSDFAPLGSFSTLDELGPTETAWQPHAFRMALAVPRQPAPRPTEDELPLAELA